MYTSTAIGLGQQVNDQVSEEGVLRQLLENGLKINTEINERRVDIYLAPSAAKLPYVPKRSPESQEYWTLPESERKRVAATVDRAFRQVTGITRKLDPKNPKDLPWIRTWLRLRDHMMGIRTQSTTPPPGIILVRGGSYRPMPQRNLPSRGRYGQREGQRRPLPNPPPPGRRRFEERQRRRDDKEFMRWMETVKQSQAFLERWAKEGSEPKTAAQRALKVFAKLLEVFDEISSHWSKTHARLQASLYYRNSIADFAKRNPNLTNDEKFKKFLSSLEKELEIATQQLKSINQGRVNTMQHLQGKIKELERLGAGLSPTNPDHVKSLSTKLTELQLSAEKLSSQLKDDLTKADRLIYGLPLPPRQIDMGPPQPRMNEY